MKTEQRVIKYRAWNERFNEMWDCNRLALNRIHMSVTGNGFLTHDEDGALELLPFLKPMQFTGLVDKEGNEIYPDDILRIKGRMGNQKEYGYDALYKVMLSTYEGLSLRFLKLTNQDPDNHENSYPISISMGFSDKRLSTDYRNDQYNRLAVADHFYDDSSRNRHQDHHYTNDIQVVGNVFQNIDLLPSTTTI